MDSQIAIKPAYNVEIKKNMKTHAKVAEQTDQQYTSCKFRTQSDINGVFKQQKYIDYVIPSKFNDISKINQVVIDLECEVSKLIQPENIILNQNVFMSYDVQDLNRLSLTAATYPGLTSNIVTIPINVITSENSTHLTFDSQTLANGGSYLFGNYVISNIKASSSWTNTNLFAVIGFKNANGVFAPIATNPSAPVVLTGSIVSYNFTINFPTKIPIENGQKLTVFFYSQNTVPNPVATTVTIQFDNTVLGPLQPSLVRNVYVGNELEYVQNLPVWTMFDRIQILINGKVADEISTMNYFCELSLHNRETLVEYSKSLLIDPDHYGILFNYPGAILMRNATNAPLTVTERFKCQIPLFSTFLQSENYLTDFVQDQITFRVFFRPYDLFKVSAVNNQADTMSLVSTSLYLMGSKFEEQDVRNHRAMKGKDHLVSMIFLRKYGSDKLIRSQQTTNLTYSPIYGQSMYDLSFLNGRYVSLFSMILPENVIGGENYIQLALPCNAASTQNNYISDQLTVVGNLNQYPIKFSAKASKKNLNGFEYTYTPESAFKLDRVSLIDQLGTPIYQNLQYADFLRNVMSTTGVNNDFLKTYAIYPMYFSNNIHNDYKTQHASSGYLTMQDIYNIEIILSNPDASSLPFYNGAGTLVNTLQNSLYTCGLQIAEMHIRPNGRIEIIAN